MSDTKSVRILHLISLPWDSLSLLVCSSYPYELVCNDPLSLEMRYDKVMLSISSRKLTEPMDRDRDNCLPNNHQTGRVFWRVGAWEVNLQNRFLAPLKLWVCLRRLEFIEKMLISLPEASPCSARFLSGHCLLRTRLQNCIMYRKYLSPPRFVLPKPTDDRTCRQTGLWPAAKAANAKLTVTKSGRRPTKASLVRNSWKWRPKSMLSVVNSPWTHTYLTGPCVCFFVWSIWVYEVVEWFTCLPGFLACLLAGGLVGGLLACLLAWLDSPTKTPFTGKLSEFSQIVAARKMTCGTNTMESHWMTPARVHFQSPSSLSIEYAWFPTIKLPSLCPLFAKPMGSTN